MRRLKNLAHRLKSSKMGPAKIDSHTSDAPLEEDRTEEERAGEERAGEERAGEERAGEERAGEERAGEERAGEERAGEEWAEDNQPRGNQAGAGRCIVITLPYELINSIANVASPEALVPFASTCKYISSVLSETLQLHREAHNLYAAASDQEPLVIPALLKSASGLSSPIAAWHVQTLEIWTHRAEWEDWTVFNPKGDDLEPFDDPVSHSYSDEEIRHYLDLGRTHLHLSEDHIDDARRELYNGGDGFIKALLIGLCPRLRDLKFVRQEIPDVSQDVPEKVTEESMWWRESTGVSPTMHSTTWFKRAIFNIVDKETTWPPGFAALYDVAVGISPDGWGSTRDDDNGEYVSYEVLCGLFSLPNIDTIYFNEIVAGEVEIGYDLENWDDEEDHWRLPYRTSSVKHLYLHHIAALHPEFGESLINAPAQLQTASYQAGIAENCDYVDRIVAKLCKAHKGSLKNLMLHGGGLRGYRCMMYLPMDVELCEGLRQVSIHASDIMLDFANNDKKEKATIKSLAEGIESNFPQSLEVMYVVGTSTDMELYERDTLSCLDGAFARVIDGRGLPNLKAIYVEDMERQTIKRFEQPRDRLCFAKAVAAGRRAGVDVHTIANREPAKHQINTPIGLNKYDLKTGQYKGVRPTDGNLKLNVSEGYWENATCNDCGTCDYCLALYPEDVWKTLGVGIN